MFDIEDNIPAPISNPKQKEVILKLAIKLHSKGGITKKQAATLALDKLGMTGFIGTKESAICFLRRGIKSK